jgi:hypothetical protein
MSNITSGILPILLAPGLNESQWEFGYYKLQNVNEVFDIGKVNNWQDNATFRGVDDGYYFIVARMKAKHNVYDFKKEIVSCNADACVLRILAVTKIPSTPSCTLRILEVTKVPSGGSGGYEEFSGIALLGVNV